MSKWSARRNSNPSYKPESIRIVVAFIGGLGNQMFQRAFGLALTTRGYDVSYNLGWDTTGHALSYFESLPFSGNLDSVFTQEDLSYNPAHLCPKEPCTMRGYWQSEKYFEGLEDQVRQLFKFKSLIPGSPAANWLTRITNSTSISIHIRRGDYLNWQNFHGLLSVEYYKRGVDLIREAHPDAKVFVFSDDRLWCHENLPSDFSIVDGTDKYEDLQLMSLCQHAVVSNSSFGWWGAWLGDARPERVIIAPEKWFVTSEMKSQDIVPERWIKL